MQELNPVAPRGRTNGPPNPKSAPGSRLTVLLIDDEPVNQELLAAMLESRQGIDLLFATNAEEGLKIAKAKRPGLIFLDLLPPDRHGAEVFRDLRSMDETGSIAIVIVTTFDAEDVPEDIREQARDVLTVPVDTAKLLAIVDERLDAP